MAEISNLAYIVFNVRDLDQWERFAVDVVGLQVGRRDDAQMLLRMDEYEQRLCLERGDDDDLAAAGWEFATEDALEAFVRRIAEAGVRVSDGGRELAQRRRVEKLYRCEDPTGYTHEFVFGPALAPIGTPFHSAVLQGRGFETGPLGVGHILPVARDYKTSVAFYRNVLGLRVSDYIRQELAPGLVADATFFHTVTGRHHSLATGQLPGAKRLNHFMVQYQSMDDVGLAYDRCEKAGVPIAMSLGHHPNDRMFSFYCRTPSGFNLEIGYGGIVIDDASWTVASYSQLSDWGHKRSA